MVHMGNKRSYGSLINSRKYMGFTVFLVVQTLTSGARWWFLKIVIFTPTWGNDPIGLNILQMG